MNAVPNDLRRRSDMFRRAASRRAGTAARRVVSGGLAEATATPIHPRQRTIVAVDIEGSTDRNNTERARLRDDMYELLEKSLLDSGITGDLRDEFVDRGDGAMVFIHPADTVPHTLLLSTFVPTLSDRLAEHGTTGQYGFRLRAAVHFGQVHFDRRGPFGEDVDLTVRLLDAPRLKERLRDTGAPLVLVVSELVYWSVVRHGYEGIDETAFAPEISLELAGRAYHGWVNVPAETLRVAAPAPRVDRVS